jgi:hypothetical protein
LREEVNKLIESQLRNLNERDDTFNKARLRAFFSRLSAFLVNRKDDLIPFSFAYSILKPKSEAYRGIKQVPLSLIVGSEGRYRDFNRVFLPRGVYLRERWERINKAHKRHIELPPVRLYEIGGVYFVRDGNHRISVALARGVEFVDAEVISLSTEIKLHKDMSQEDLKKAVIDLEKKKFMKETNLKKTRPEADLSFTAPGRYDVLLEHIQVHKYFINLDKKEEIPYAEAVVSWYDNVYKPIADVIEEENILARFPGRTTADLYIWMVKYWDGLKRKYGQDYPTAKAVRRYTEKYGKTFPEKVKMKLVNFGRRIKRLFDSR